MIKNLLFSLFLAIVFPLLLEAQTQQRPAVIVCPGGSYCWLSKKTEGSEVASWLHSLGMDAYVLHYPTAGWAGFAWHTRLILPGNQYPDQLNAFRKLYRELRKKGYDKIGAMGFSAGGHLVLNAAEEDLLPETRNDSLWFCAPIYPVVTLRESCVHHRSRRGLLGEYRWRKQQWCDSLSMELHANRVTCPVFMINCQDDPIVDYHNSLLMDSALTANNKPHFYKLFRTVGHGFGTDASKTSKEAIEWKKLFSNWINKLL